MERRTDSVVCAVIPRKCKASKELVSEYGMPIPQDLNFHLKRDTTFLVLIPVNIYLKEWVVAEFKSFQGLKEAASVHFAFPIIR